MSLKVPVGYVTDDLDSVDSVVSFNKGNHDESAKNQVRPNTVTIPVLPRPLAVFCLVANIILPGSGTLVSAFAVFCFNEKDEGFFHLVNICLSNVVVAICQLATVIFLIGWIWSIIWGCAIVGHSDCFTVKETPTLSKVLPTPSITFAHAYEDSPV